MRFKDSYLLDDEAEPHFHKDIPRGIRVSCGSCSTINDIVEDLPHNPSRPDIQCIGCQKYFVYRPWWSW